MMDTPRPADSGPVVVAPDFEVHLSIHAKRRFKQRLGKPQRAAAKAAARALLIGLDPWELPRFQQDNLAASMSRHNPTNNAFAKIMDGFAFLFVRRHEDGVARAVLITVLPGYDQPPGR
jgi:hypothetical protein